MNSKDQVLAVYPDAYCVNWRDRDGDPVSFIYPGKLHPAISVGENEAEAWDNAAKSINDKKDENEL